MPDVGVLNLQIQDNSKQAVGGLNNLADALTRVKNAVSSGLKLTNVANGIERLGKVVNENISGSTIVKLGQVADELAKLKGLENVNIRINTGSGVDSIRDSVAETVKAVKDVDSGFETVSERTVEASAGVQSVNEAIRETTQLLNQNAFDPEKIPIGKLGDNMDDAAGRVQQDVDMVKKSFETLSHMGAFDHITSSVKETGDAVTAIIPYNENLENSWGRICDRIKTAKEEADKAAKIRAQQEEAFYSSVGKHDFSMAETNAMADNLTKLDLYKAKLREAEEQYNKFVNTLGADNAKTVAAGLKVSDLRDKIWEFTNGVKDAKAEIGSEGLGAVNNLFDSSKIDLMTMKLDGMKDALARDIDANKLDSQQIAERTMRIQDLAAQIDRLREAEDGGTKGTISLTERIKELKNAAKHDFFGKLISKLGQIAKYRFLRSLIRHITSGFSEGTKNVYEYSKALGTSFAPAMDSAASSLAQMKNSVGAAAAPVLQSLIPIMQTLVNWFITATNYVNQFFALLRGQTTWTRAVPTTVSAFDKQKKAAKGASNAIKDLLADWDELNIIQSQTSGAGSGAGTSTAEDYLNMFEEVGTFENKVKDVVKFVKDNFESIKTIAEGIGLAILAWKVSKAFGNTLGFLQTLELTAGLTLLVTGVKMSTAAGYNIGTNGINSSNLLQAIGGIFASALGGALIGVAYGGIVGGAIGLWVGATIGLFALGMSWAEGELDKLYGDIQLSATQVQEEVDKLFKLDVNAELTNATVDANSIAKAKADVAAALHEAEADYATLKLKPDAGTSKELTEKVARIIDTTNILLKQYQKQISIGFGFEPNYEDPKFVQAFSTDKLSGLEAYITKLGNKIGEILEDGIVDELEGPLLEDTMRKLLNVTNAIATGKASGTFAADMERGYYNADWTKVNKDSIQAYADRYASMMSDLEEAGFYQARDTQAALKGIYAGMVQRNLDEPGTYTDAEIQQAYDNYMNYDLDKAVKDYVDKVSAEGREVFLRNMMTAFGSAVSKANFDYSLYGRGMNAKTDLKDWINSSVATNLNWDIDTFKKTMETMGITGLDLLTEEMRKRYIIQVLKALGENDNTYKKLQKELNIPMEEINAVRKKTSGSTNFLAPSAGVPSTTYVPSGQTTTEQTQVLTNGVKNGIKGMQDDQRLLMTSLISLVQRISTKEFTIKISPNSDWGRHNAKSNNEYETVIGG